MVGDKVVHSLLDSSFGEHGCGGSGCSGCSGLVEVVLVQGIVLRGVVKGTGVGVGVHVFAEYGANMLRVWRRSKET